MRTHSSPVTITTGVRPTKILNSVPYCLAHLLMTVWESNGTFSYRKGTQSVAIELSSLQVAQKLRRVLSVCVPGPGCHRARLESVQVCVEIANDSASCNRISAPAVCTQLRTQLGRVCYCMYTALSDSCAST